MFVITGGKLRGQGVTLVGQDLVRCKAGFIPSPLYKVRAVRTPEGVGGQHAQHSGNGKRAGSVCGQQHFNAFW